MTANAQTGFDGPILSFQNIWKVYPRTKGSSSNGSDAFVALEDISFSVPRGQFIAIVGASGCGKTTLLNMAAGLVKSSMGEVALDGKPPTCPNFDLGYMFARDALLPWRSARRNVGLPLEARKHDRDERNARADGMLRMVGLEGKEGLYPAQLSQGMRQRVALARTFAADPQILLMDEPFAALDARTRINMQQEFLRIWESDAEALESDEPKRTVFLVTHDLQEATLLADRVIVMLPNPGRIAADQKIDLPRPRAEMADEIMFTDQFRAIHHGLFQLLEGAIPAPKVSVQP